MAWRGNIHAAIETGTFKAEGTLALRAAVDRVWTVELDDPSVAKPWSAMAKARASRSSTGRRTRYRPSSPPRWTSRSSSGWTPTVAWPTAWGSRARECRRHYDVPLIAELRTIPTFARSASSWILIDDAITCLNPPSRAWRTLVEVIDLLRAESRYITILDESSLLCPPLCGLSSRTGTRAGPTR